MIIGSLLFIPTTQAEIKTYTGVGEYTIGERDTLEIARQGAKEKSMRNALEQAGILVTSQSLTEDSPFHANALTYRSRGECYKARGDIISLKQSYSAGRINSEA